MTEHAFPFQRLEPRANGVLYPVTDPGMTLRDWFAGQALPAVIEEWGETSPDPGETWFGMTARLAYEAADAMMRVREARK